jgi:hypothetical protein
MMIAHGILRSAEAAGGLALGALFMPHGENPPGIGQSLARNPRQILLRNGFLRQAAPTISSVT